MLKKVGMFLLQALGVLLVLAAIGYVCMTQLSHLPI